MTLLAKISLLVPGRFRSQTADSALSDQPTWDLVIGRIHLGRLDLVGYETPWITAAFSPSPEFARWVPLILWWQRAEQEADDGLVQPMPPEVESLWDEAQREGRLIAVERGDVTSRRSEPFHFSEDFKFVSFR